jgi:hypothetical protein
VPHTCPSQAAACLFGGPARGLTPQQTRFGQRAAACAGLTAAACAGLVCCWTMQESVLLAFAIGWLSADHCIRKTHHAYSLELLTANARRQVSSTHHASCRLQQASSKNQSRKTIAATIQRPQTHVQSRRTTRISYQGCHGYRRTASTCACCPDLRPRLPTHSQQQLQHLTLATTLGRRCPSCRYTPMLPLLLQHGADVCCAGDTWVCSRGRRCRKACMRACISVWQNTQNHVNHMMSI